MEDQQIAVERQPARRDLGADGVLPDQRARPCVERLDDPAGVGEIHRPVVDERGGLIGAAVAHRPHPGELQLIDVVGRDLRQRAVARRAVVVPQHEPVVRLRIAQHLIGHRHEVRHGAGDRHAGARVR